MAGIANPALSSVVGGLIRSTRETVIRGGDLHTCARCRRTGRAGEERNAMLGVILLDRFSWSGVSRVLPRWNLGLLG